MTTAKFSSKLTERFNIGPKTIRILEAATDSSGDKRETDIKFVKELIKIYLNWDYRDQAFDRLAYIDPDPDKRLGTVTWTNFTATLTRFENRAYPNVPTYLYNMLTEVHPELYGKANLVFEDQKQFDSEDDSGEMDASTGTI